MLKIEPFSDLITCDFIDIISPVFIRYHKNGQSLLVLLPSEESEMTKALEAKKIPINKIRYCNATWYYNLIFRYVFSNYIFYFSISFLNNKVEKELIGTKFYL